MQKRDIAQAGAAITGRSYHNKLDTKDITPVATADLCRQLPTHIQRPRQDYVRRLFNIAATEFLTYRFRRQGAEAR